MQCLCAVNVRPSINCQRCCHGDLSPSLPRPIVFKGREGVDGSPVLCFILCLLLRCWQPGLYGDGDVWHEAFGWLVEILIDWFWRGMTGLLHRTLLRQTGKRSWLEAANFPSGRNKVVVVLLEYIPCRWLSIILCQLCLAMLCFQLHTNFAFYIQY